MSNNKPSVPSDQRSPKGPGSDPAEIEKARQKPENIDQTGDRATIRQNTSNQQDKR